jgi:hypothetical protein
MTSTWRNLATISAGLWRFQGIVVSCGPQNALLSGPF